MFGSLIHGTRQVRGVTRTKHLNWELDNVEQCFSRQQGTMVSRGKFNVDGQINSPVKSLSPFFFGLGVKEVNFLCGSYFEPMGSIKSW